MSRNKKQSKKMRKITNHKQKECEDNFKDSETNISCDESCLINLKQGKGGDNENKINIYISIISVVLSIVSIIIAQKIADSTADFENKNVALDIELSTIYYEYNDCIKVKINLTQGKIKKLYLADIDGDSITYYNQNVIEENEDLEIQIPAKSLIKQEDDLYYSFINTKQFALVIFDYSSNIFCYYVVYLARPYIYDNLEYETKIVDMDGNVVDRFQRETDGIKEWEDHNLIIDCSLINDNTIEAKLKDFSFDYKYPLFDRSKLVESENKYIKSNPVIECTYEYVSEEEICKNLGKIHTDINNSIN